MEFRDFDRICYLDFETTGAWSPLNQPIQVCLKVIDKGEKPVIFNSYIKCPYRLSTMIMQLTGITDEILIEKGRDIREVFLDIAKIIFEKPNTLIVGFKIRKFDQKFLDYYLTKCWNPQWPQHCKMSWPASKIFDIAGRYKAELLGLRQHSDESLLDFQIRCCNARYEHSHSLANAMDFYGIKSNGKFHTADEDVDKTELVFKAQVKRMIAEQRAQKQLSGKHRMQKIERKKSTALVHAA